MKSPDIGKSSYYEKRNKLLIEMFRHMLHVHVTNNTLKSYNNYMTSPKITEPFRAAHFPMPNGHSLLVLPVDIEPGELSHECLHVVQHILKEIGAGYKEDEFVCYLLQYIVENVTNFVEKAKKGLDKPLEI